MKLKTDTIDVKVDIPTQDLEDLVATITAGAVVVIGFYMAADSARHILKSLSKEQYGRNR